VSEPNRRTVPRKRCTLTVVWAATPSGLKPDAIRSQGSRGRQPWALGCNPFGVALASPNHKRLLIVPHEISGTTTIYQISRVDQ
jgi:hypothetical protein